MPYECSCSRKRSPHHVVQLVCGPSEEEDSCQGKGKQGSVEAMAWTAEEGGGELGDFCFALSRGSSKSQTWWYPARGNAQLPRGTL